LIRQFFTRQFLTFLLTGATAAAINFASRIVYSQWLDFPEAVVLAYITGMMAAFVLAKVFVFTESRQAIHRSAMFFILVNVVALAQTWLVSMAFAYYLLPAIGIKSHVGEIAHAVGIAVPVVTSYIGHKRWSFR
jgi:putative flippase GtrA